MSNLIYNKTYASDHPGVSTIDLDSVQVTWLLSNGLERTNKKLKSFGIKAVTLSQVVVVPLRQAEKRRAALYQTGVGTSVDGLMFSHGLY